MASRRGSTNRGGVLTSGVASRRGSTNRGGVLTSGVASRRGSTNRGGVLTSGVASRRGSTVSTTNDDVGLLNNHEIIRCPPEAY